MGKRTLIEYSQTPDVNFFLCRRCRTHIALTHELFAIVPALDLGYFRNVVNVQVDCSAYYDRDEVQTSADVYCYTCDKPLGWKVIEVASDSSIELNPGTFILLLDELLLWNGGRMLYAESNEPV